MYNKNRDHLLHIKTLLTELDTMDLKLNLGKCNFFQNDIKFLGYVISREGTMVGKD